MKTYMVTYRVVVESDNYDEAIRESKALISDRDYQPAAVESLEHDNPFATWQEVR